MVARRKEKVPVLQRNIQIRLLQEVKQSNRDNNNRLTPLHLYLLWSRVAILKLLQKQNERRKASTYQVKKKILLEVKVICL